MTERERLESTNGRLRQGANSGQLESAELMANVGLGHAELDASLLESLGELFELARIHLLYVGRGNGGCGSSGGRGLLLVMVMMMLRGGSGSGGRSCRCRRCLHCVQVMMMVMVVMQNGTR